MSYLVILPPKSTESNKRFLILNDASIKMVGAKAETSRVYPLGKELTIEEKKKLGLK